MVYKLLLDIYEASRNYAALAACHDKLHQSFLNIISCVCYPRFFPPPFYNVIDDSKRKNVAQNRLLGTYYRVGFFGDGFGEQNTCEYIYKEPKITRLVEIKDRLLVCTFILSFFNLIPFYVLLETIHANTR